jgi:hypothetical protein
MEATMSASSTANRTVTFRQTRAASKEELVRNLKDLLTDIESGEIPYVRKVEELVLAE